MISAATLKKYELPGLFVLVLLSSLVFISFFFPSLTALTRYWDGPNYMYVAKTLYEIPENHPLSWYTPSPAYFACHLPLYPLLVRALSAFGGYESGLLLATILSTLAFVWVFYSLLKSTGWVLSPFWSCVFVLFLPARFLIYRHVGATEPLFLALTAGTLLMVYREKWFWACVLASLAACTRITGILLMPSLALYLLLQTRMWEGAWQKVKTHWKKILALSLIPVPLLLVFTFYYFQYGDFFAYWSWNQKLLSRFPFEILKAYAFTGNSQIAEFYLLLYLLHGLGLVLLGLKRLWLPFAVTLIPYLLTLFIFHEDLSRYYLVLAPFTWILAFDALTHSKAARLIFCMVVIPLVYIYAWGLIPTNQIDLPTYENLLKFF